MELIQNLNHNNNPTIEDEREAFYKTLPPGFRFTPYDRELILFYLIPKIKGDVVPLNLMHEANIYHCHPQQLAETYTAQGKGKWYFFTPRDKKYMNGGRPNRKAGNGYWKATGADKKIMDESEILIGYKRSLVYYEGKPKKGQGHKTNWIMYELVVKDNPSSTLPGMRLDNAVLCSIHYNDVNYNNVPINGFNAVNNDTNVIVTENVVINNTNDYVYNYPQQQQQQQGGGLMFPNTTQSTPLALPPPPPSSLPPLPASDYQYGSTSNGNEHIWNNHSGTGLYSSMMNEYTPSSSSSSSLLPPTNLNMQIMDSATEMFTASQPPRQLDNPMPLPETTNGVVTDVNQTRVLPGNWTQQDTCPQLDNIDLPEDWTEESCTELVNYLMSMDY